MTCLPPLAPLPPPSGQTGPTVSNPRQPMPGLFSESHLGSLCLIGVIGCVHWQLPQKWCVTHHPKTWVYNSAPFQWPKQITAKPNIKSGRGGSNLGGNEFYQFKFPHVPTLIPGLSLTVKLRQCAYSPVRRYHLICVFRNCLSFQVVQI